MSVRRALAFSHVEKYGAFGLGLISSMIISRLLTPEAIGAFSVGAVLVGLIGTVRELSLGTYLVQERTLSDEDIGAAFTVAVTLGISLAALLALVSYPAALFYGDPRVGTTVVVLALGFLFVPIGLVSQGLMTRAMRFGALAAIRLSHAVISAVVSIGLILYGLGPLSLAWGNVVAIAATSVASFAVHPYRMGLLFAWAPLRKVLGFGGQATVGSIADEIAQSIPDLVVGRIHGLDAAAYYGRSQSVAQVVLRLVVRATTPVALPYFAERARAGESVKPYYLKGTALLTGLGLPLLAVLAVLAEPAVLALFGPQWGPSVPLVRILCAAWGIFLTYSLAVNALFAVGAAREVVLTKLAWLPIQIACVLVGARFGLTGLTLALVLSMAAHAGLLARAINRTLGISGADVLKAVSSSIPLALASALGAASGLLVDGQGLWDHVVALALGGTSATIAFGVVLAMGRHPLHALIVPALTARIGDRRSG